MPVVERDGRQVRYLRQADVLFVRTGRGRGGRGLEEHSGGRRHATDGPFAVMRRRRRRGRRRRRRRRLRLVARTLRRVCPMPVMMVMMMVMVALARRTLSVRQLVAGGVLTAGAVAP